MKTIDVEMHRVRTSVHTDAARSANRPTKIITRSYTGTEQTHQANYCSHLALSISARYPWMKTVAKWQGNRYWSCFEVWR